MYCHTSDSEQALQYSYLVFTADPFSDKLFNHCNLSGNVPRKKLDYVLSTTAFFRSKHVRQEVWFRYSELQSTTSHTCYIISHLKMLVIKPGLTSPRNNVTHSHRRPAFVYSHALPFL